MTGWTPGPWMLGKSGNLTNDGARPIVTDETRICLVDMQSETARKDAWRSEDPEREANARLLSAAKNLYIALEYARRFLNDEDHDTVFVDAALKKARGESE